MYCLPLVFMVKVRERFQGGNLGILRGKLLFLRTENWTGGVLR
jgi:hypothetical protein